jgi:hypothetical protein
MHAPPVEGNFTNAIKPRVVEDYNAYMGFVDKSDNGEQLRNCPANTEVDEETVFPPHRHDNTQRHSYS